MLAAWTTLAAQMLFAQAPNISYSPSTNVYTVGTAISTLSPTNSGGSITPATYTQVTTFAGSTSGTSGTTNATGTSARFNSPSNVVTDASGNLYIADFGNNEIRKITPAGVVTTFAGSSTGASGFTDATGTSARFNNPAGLAIDASGNIFVADNANNAIREISPAGVVTTFAGSTSGTSGTTNATGTSARFRNPAGIAFDGSGNLYVADYSNNEIRKITTAGVVTTFAGSSSGTSGYTNATGTSARFKTPAGLVFDSSGNLYVTDLGNNAVRKVTPSAVVTTFAGSTSGTAGSTNATGTSARFSAPAGIVIDGAGNLYVGENGNNDLREITPAAVVTLLAGSSTQTAGTTDGVGTAARFSNVTDMNIDVTGTMYVTDNANNNIREISLSGYTISPSLPAGLSFDGTTGIISGTPTAVSSATTYTITAYNYYGSDNTTVTITCNPASPTATGGTFCGSSSVTLTASGGLPAGGTYNWYAASSGGSSLATGSSYSPTPASTTTYYVDYTSGGVTTSPRVSATATINSAPVISTAPTSPTSSFYLSYPFTGNANDASGNANNGTVQNGASLTTDRYGAANSAYSFNGSNQYISTTTAIGTPAPQNFSISVWFNTSSAGGMLVGYSASKTGAASQYDRHIYMDNSGHVYFGIYTTSSGTANTINSTSTYADGNWHHAVATCSTTSGSSLYIDGELQASSSTMTTAETYTGNGYWRVGYNTLSGWANAPSDLYFTGSLDDIAIYKSTLTAAQVYSLYGAGSSPVCEGSALSLQVNTVAGATYSWTGPSGYSSTSQNPTVSTSATTAMAGTYTCTVTGSNGCTSSINVTADVNAAPVSTFTATSSVLVGANAAITYSGTYSASSTYTWDFDSGTIASGSGVGPYTVNWSTVGSKTVTLTVTNSSGCSSTSTQTVVVGTYGTYAFSDLITLNTTSLGISSNLTNFPALLSIQDNNLIISNTCADKVYYPNGPNYDFAFYDSSTSAELYYQVESYNQTTGTLLVWVRIPTLTYASNKTITFYYGSQSPTVTHNTAFFQNTWASDYKAVFHFNESSYTGSVTDATAGGHTGTTSGMTSANLVTGKIGTGYSFSGAQSIISNAVTITGAFTISAWVKLSSTGKDQKAITNQAAAGGSTGGYKLGVFTDNTPESESGTAVDRSSSPTPTAFASGVWHYIQGVYTGSTLSTYVDGTQYKILTTSNNPSSTTPLYIGVGEGGTQYYFYGTIDEVHISNVGKTADWLKAEYADQNSPTTFTTVGSTSTNTTNAAAISGALTYTWTGGAGTTDPTNANNWNNTTAGTTNQLPAFDGSATLVIPTGLAVYPSLTADASLYGLTIGSGASLNLNGHTLSVGCNIYNSSTGQILYGSSTSSGLTWNGSASAQTYTGSSTANTAQLGSMTINNSSGGTVTISGGPVDIYNTLTITSGNLVVGSSPAALTLKSTATQTASVAALPSGSTITGNVTVERYITGGLGYRGYRLISSPVYTATVSSNNIYSLNYLQNSIYLTGSAGGGFDKTGNPTLYLFREDQVPSNATFTSGNFWGISAINNATSYNYYLNGGSTNYNIPVGNGLMFFFRGNRASASVTAETQSSYTTPVAVALSTTGTLNQGQVIVHDWYTPASANLGYTVTTSGSTNNATVRGFNLVGNPYASSIDWEQYNTTTTTSGIYAHNVSNTVYEFNPATKNYDTYQVGGAFTNHGSRTIASGQGFFVQATSSSAPQLIFNETAKTSTQNTGLNLFLANKGAIAAAMGGSGGPDQHLRLQLAKDSINTDDVYIGFRSNADTKYSENEDAPYNPGSGLVSLSSFSEDKVQLAINKLPLPKLKPEIIPLKVAANNYGEYRLNLTEIAAIPKIFKVWLMDHFNKDSVDLRQNTSYIFDMTTDTNSYGANRFELVIREDTALNVHLLDITATKVTGGVQVVWKTENEEDYTNFTVERSTDGGLSYTVLGGMASGALGTYSFLDKNPAAKDIYRLKIEDLNGTITYSKTVTVIYGEVDSAMTKVISIYPNPARSIINLTITPPVNAPAKQGTGSNPPVHHVYNITVVNMLGSVLKTAKINQQTWQTDVSNLAPGTYIIQVVNDYDDSVTGQGIFIKL